MNILLQKMVNSKIKLVAIIFFVITLFLLNSHINNHSNDMNTINNDFEIRVNTVSTPLFGLVSLTEKMKYFKKNNLDVKIKYSDVGKISFEEMEKKNCDISISGQTPIVQKTFTDYKFKILASIGCGKNVFKIISRKDLGILEPQDLKNKKINAQKGTSIELFLISYLEKNQMKIADVKQTNLESSKAFEDLLNGEIDAVVSYEPLTKVNIEKLGDNAVVFSEKSLYSTYALLCVSEEFLQDHPKQIEKFLKSLSEGLNFLRENNELVIDYFSETFNLSKSTTKSFMDEIEFNISLKSTLILTLNSELNWLRDNNVVKSDKIPSIEDYFEYRYLKKILPRNVDF